MKRRRHDLSSVFLTFDVPDAPCKDYADTLATTRDGVRIRRSGQILRFTFHGCVDHGFVDGCEPFCDGQQKCVFPGVRVSYWQFDRRSCIDNTEALAWRLASLYPLLLADRFICGVYQNASTLPLRFLRSVRLLFACQWTSNIVPVTVLPSLIYSTLTRTAQSHSEFLSFSTPGRACQDVRVVYAIERAEKRRLTVGKCRRRIRPRRPCVWESILVVRYGQDDHHLAASYTESLALWRRIFLIGCIQHDMFALCEPVIILYGLIPETLAALSLSFSKVFWVQSLFTPRLSRGARR